MLRCAIKYGSLGNPRLLLVGKKPIIRMYGGSASSFKREIVTDVTFVAVPLCAMGHKVQGPRQESDLMGSKPFRRIENYLILLPFSVKI